jgi:hypothetical protein
MSACNVSAPLDNPPATHIRYAKKMSVKLVHLDQRREGGEKGNDLEDVEDGDGREEEHVRERIPALCQLKPPLPPVEG